MSSFSAQWFIAYYASLGTLMISYGLYLITRNHQAAEQLAEAAMNTLPPPAFKTVLKYFLLFTIPGLVLSFFPFSWIEFLFTLWCLFIIYTLGQLLLQWKSVSKQILQNRGVLHKKVRFAGINMVSLGVVVYMLCYLLISQ